MQKFLVNNGKRKITVNKKRIIKVKEAYFDCSLVELKLDKYESRGWCKVELSQAIGKEVKPGMKLALVDLDDYLVEGVNCD